MDWSEIIGFINPGSLGDQLPNKDSAQADNAQLTGPAQVSKQQARRVIQSPTGRSDRGGATPVFRLRPTFPTEGLTSVSSPPPDGLSDRKAWPKHYFRLRPHVSDRGMKKSYSLLFSD